jgi:serine/threonine protein phosphatase PrpC
MTTPDDPAPCPACGASSIPGARYCEACGHELADPPPTETASTTAGGAGEVHSPSTPTGTADVAGAPEPAGAAGAITTPRYGTSSAPPPGCAICHHTEVNPDGYCDNCGTRRPAAAKHSEVDLGGLAGVSDIGSRHHHNEDAMGLAALGPVTAAVVCDGVSSSARPDTAATAATIAATRVFIAALPTVAEPETPNAETEPATIDDVGTHEVTYGGAVAVLHDATAAAQTAAALANGDDGNPNPPSTTFVAVIVTAAAVTVGWVGDSRAYWVPDLGTPGGPSCLTVDDTLAGQLSAAGVAMATDAPNAGALIRWLGADATDTEPHTSTLVPPGPGRVVVCSDGLYRYVPQPDQLANATPAGPPIEVASALVQLALEAGGQDNVTVVVLPYPPEVEVRAHGDEPARHDRPDRDEADQAADR